MLRRSSQLNNAAFIYRDHRPVGGQWQPGHGGRLPLCVGCERVGRHGHPAPRGRLVLLRILGKEGRGGGVHAQQAAALRVPHYDGRPTIYARAKHVCRERESGEIKE